MAVYHFRVKTVSRSLGRSATGAAAYRAATRILDQRTGRVHDYCSKGGVLSSRLIFPHPSIDIDCSQLWNRAELAENRKNSTVAREFELAIPCEFPDEIRFYLVEAFSSWLVGRYGFAAQVNLHAPPPGGDPRNFHSHILTTTREIEESGELGRKCRILDDKRSGPKEVKFVREVWANTQNVALETYGSEERVSHLSHKARGLYNEPTVHLGPTATALLRRGAVSRLADRNVQIYLKNMDLADKIAILSKYQEIAPTMPSPEDLPPFGPAPKPDGELDPEGGGPKM